MGRRVPRRSESSPRLAIAAPSDTLVFRDGKQTLPGGALLTELLRELSACQFASGDSLKHLLVSSLLRAGELECGIHDQFVDSEDLELSAKTISAITDELAYALLNPAHARIRIAQAQRLGRNLNVPAQLKLSPPEGFCFYGLHPLDFAETVSRLSYISGDVAVIGIRTIGTTLSAITAAALHRSHFPGSKVTIDRTTVRPVGHPFDRATHFSAAQEHWVRRMASRRATFLVVDEGPGLSGSSFISVGEALEKLGADPQRVHFVGTRQVDPAQLRAKDATQRWSRFRSLAVQFGAHLPSGADVCISGGQWRQHFLHGRDQTDWPAVWTFLSSPAYLSRDRKTIYKFEGHGRYGAAAHARLSMCAEAGFSIVPRSFQEGYAGYPVVTGRALTPASVTPALLRQLAAYLAFRVRSMATANAEPSALENMARHNVERVTGQCLGTDFALPVERPVIADARMMPYEWLVSPDGYYLKFDCASHGDNHFYPGPCDIAWDIAGAIIEWQLTPHATETLLDFYASATGDDPTNRLQPYLQAYAAFQTGYAAMAANSMAADTAEQTRLLRDCHRYRQTLQTALLPRTLNARAA